MKKSIILFITVTLLSVLGAAAQGNYVFEKSIALPGNGGYDYLYVDQLQSRLYVTHGDRVHVIDLATEKVIGSIENLQGVHGIAIVNSLNRGFISDGKGSAIVAFDIKTLKIIKIIPLNNKKPDAIIYDPYSKKVFAFSGDSNDAQVIDPEKLVQTANVSLGGAPEFAVADGKGLIYNNLEDKSSIDVIDTRTLKVIQNYTLTPCGGPTGIAIDKASNMLFTVCRQNKGLSVVNINTGKIVQTLPIGSGVDAVIYDARNKMVLVSNGDGTASIFKQQSPDRYQLIQTLATQKRAKTMAMDEVRHKIYLSAPEFQAGTRTPVPGTFKVLVYSLQ